MRTVIFFIGLVINLALSAQPNVLFHDNFSRLPRGPMTGAIGAYIEYQYYPEAAPKGAWAVSTFRYNLEDSWYVRDIDSARVLVQRHNNPDNFWHPMVVAGNDEWQDYTVETSFSPLSKNGLCGIVFRYKNDRQYYLFGVRGDTILLMKTNHADAFRTLKETILIQKPYRWQSNTRLQATINVSGTKISVILNSSVELMCIDSTFKQGKIGFLSDIPAYVRSVDVTATAAENKHFQNAKTEKDKIEKDLQQKQPAMVVWKKISTTGFGVGRNLRFGDLNNDGKPDILVGQVTHHGPKDANSEVGCMTAITTEGKILWQLGQPDPWKTSLTNDVAMQIHDINGDGKNEVVYCKNIEIVVAEGATGKTLYKTATPLTPGGKPLKGGQNRFDRILGDCLFFYDFRGIGADRDIIIKDRYSHFWVLDDSLHTLWHAECTTGHYPYAYDIDGDQRDELLLGYSLFDDNGKVLWCLDSTLQDHADGVAIAKLNSDEPPVIINAASDEGMLLIDLKGNILKHHFIGHVQNPAVANFRDDLPGLEIVSVNFWANQGIIHLYDSKGNIYRSFEPSQFGSMCLPLNWTGKTEEYFILNVNVDVGGVYDGWGRKVMNFPDDGHPDMCYAVANFFGDCRDEIVVWNPQEIWIYTQKDKPLSKTLYQPKRNPLWNESNYKATVSEP